MANHKKHPNCNRRQACKLCKPWKIFHAGKSERIADKNSVRLEAYIRVADKV